MQLARTGATRAALPWVIDQGHFLKTELDHYVVRWQENNRWHARYFAQLAAAEAFMDYVREFDANAYAARVG